MFRNLIENFFEINHKNVKNKNSLCHPNFIFVQKIVHNFCSRSFLDKLHSHVQYDQAYQYKKFQNSALEL